MSEIEEEAELEEVEKSEKELIEVNNKLAKELKKVFTSLTLKEIQKRIPDRKKIQFKSFDWDYQREPIALIPNNVDLKDLLQLLNLFISPEIYELIAKNTNKYAKTKESLTTIIAIRSNRRIWLLIIIVEIRVFFGICIYMGVYQEPRYRIYWEFDREEGS